MNTPTAKRVVIGSMIVVVIVASAGSLLRRGATSSAPTGNVGGTSSAPTGNVGGTIGGRFNATSPGSGGGSSSTGPVLAAPIGGLVAAGALSALAGPAPDIAATLALMAVFTVLATDGATVLKTFSGAPARATKVAAGYNRGDYTPAPRASQVQGFLSAVQGIGRTGSDALITPGVSDSGGGMVTIQTKWGRIKCAASVAPQLGAMVAAAAADGVRIHGGAWRSSAEQAKLRKAHCRNPDSDPASACTPPTAPVGSSEHEVGLAIDLEDCSSRNTAAFRWMAANAARYGFRNLPSESWHWSTTGK